METLIIKDFDSAIDAYVEAWAEDFDPSTLAFSPDANIVIKLEGEQWDGAIDYKVAEFVIRLQKALLGMRNAQLEQRIRYNSRSMDDAGLRITVKVEPGCSLLNIDLKSWWDGMESKDKLSAIIVVSVMTAAAYGAVSWHNHQKEIEIAKINANTTMEVAQQEARTQIELRLQERLQDETIVREAMQVANTALNSSMQANSAMSFLTQKMKPEDTMTVGGVTLKAAEAKEVYRPIEPAEDTGVEQRYFLDGDYVVTNINREKDEVIIRFEDRKRSFSLVWLEPAELEAFYRQCAHLKKEDALPPLALQLTAYFRGGVFRHGFVQGIGPKREGALSFTEASLESARVQEEADFEQGDAE